LYANKAYTALYANKAYTALLAHADTDHPGPPPSSLPPPPPRPSLSEPELITDPTGQGAGCVLCKASDFLRGGFGDRTIMICDTCEREFHVDCLRGAARCDLAEVGASSGLPAEQSQQSLGRCVGLL
jgi:hypothetical protein